MKLRKMGAFTLAEVLITLGIIGIVAAITMPILMTKYRNQELEARFKKAYSVIGNVQMRLIGEYGSVYDYFIKSDLGGNVANAEQIKYEYIDAFSKYLNGGKICDYSGSYLSCSGLKSSPISYKTYDGSRNSYLTPDTTTDRAIVTNDSLTFFFGSWRWRNARIYVDINGNTVGPNRLGFDLFAFDIDQTDKIVPAKNTASNVDDDGNSVPVNPCSIYRGNTQYNGVGCSRYALIDKNPDNPNLSYWDNLPK